MLKKWRQDSFRWLALMVVGSGLVLAVALGGLAQSFYLAAQRQALIFCENILKSSAHGEEVITSAVKDVFDSITLDSAMFDLLNAADVKPQKLLEGLRQMRVYRETNYFIDSIYIFNRQSGQIYVSSPNATETVWTPDNFYDAEAVQSFDSYWEYSNMQPVVRNLTVSYPSMETLELMTYLRYNTLAPPGTSTVVMINVRMEVLFEQIYTPLEEMNANLLLIDEEGTLRYAAASQSGREEELVREVMKREAPNGTFVSDWDGMQTIVCYTQAFGGYWKLIFTADQKQMFSLLETQHFSVWTMLFTLMFALLCCACVILFRKLERAHRNNQIRLEAAEREQREEALEMRRRAALRFLHESDERAAQQLGQLGIALPMQDRVCLAILVLDNYLSKVTQNYARAESMALKYGICNIAQEVLKTTIMTAYEEDARCIVVLAADEADRETQMRTLQERVSGALGISLSVFLSEQILCEQLSTAYESLCDALPYQKLFGPASVVTQEMLMRRELNEYVIPDDLLRCLKKEILSMNTAQALVYLDEILDQMAQSSYRSFQRCLLQLVSALDEALETMQRNNRLNETLYTGVVIYNLGGLESIDDIRGAIEEILRQTEEAVTQKNSGRSQKLMEEIRKTVEQGCASRDFSVNTIADAVGLSPAYVGRLFKRSTGMTLVEYILEVRIEKSCSLLAQTDLPVSEILSQVGFGDAPYFYKVFKKVNGCTPAQYRANRRGA